MHLGFFYLACDNRARRPFAIHTKQIRSVIFGQTLHKFELIVLNCRHTVTRRHSMQWTDPGTCVSVSKTKNTFVSKSFVTSLGCFYFISTWTSGALLICIPMPRPMNTFLNVTITSWVHRKEGKFEFKSNGLTRLCPFLCPPIHFHSLWPNNNYFISAHTIYSRLKWLSFFVIVCHLCVLCHSLGHSPLLPPCHGK